MLNATKNRLGEFIDDNGFMNTIKKGTRLNRTTGIFTLLDVILCLSTDLFLTSGVFDYSNSDHRLVISAFRIPSRKVKDSKISSRCLNKDKLAQVREKIGVYFRQTDLSRILTVDSLWKEIKTGIYYCMDSIAPERQVIRKNSAYPWFRGELVKVMKCRDKLYHRALESGLGGDWDRFKRVRNKFCSMLRKAKSNHYKDYVRNNSVSTSKLWKHLNPVLHPNGKPKIDPTHIVNTSSHNANVADMDQGVANTFSNFFSSALARFNFHPITGCVDYIMEHFDNNFRVFSDDRESFDFPEFRSDEVEKKLNLLDEKSSPGIVGIDSRIFKGCSAELKHVVTSEWKISYVTPIYKGKGVKSTLDNYRPISVITPISKVFESLIADFIRDYFEGNSLLDSAQYGFRKGLSCEIALNTMIDDWRWALDKSEDVLAVFLDLSKAFDTVDHSLLLLKLKRYGFGTGALGLMSNYLDNRYAITRYNGNASKPELVKVGVPQGSVLGPLLFIIFMNDICFLDVSSKLGLFADDTSTYNSHRDIDILVKSVVEDLKKISEWLLKNRLIINWAKTNAILFNHNQRKNTQLTHIDFDGNNIPIVKEARLLGVLIDDKLKFDKHIGSVCRRVSAKTHLLRRFAYLFDMDFKTTLFKIFIQSQLDYCSTVFARPSSQHLADRLDRSFSRSLRKYLGISLSSTSGVFYTMEEQFGLLKPYGLMPLRYRFFVRLCTFVYTVIEGGSGLSVKILTYRTGTTLRNGFRLPAFKNAHGKYTVSTVSIKVLNSCIYGLYLKGLARKKMVEYVKDNIIGLYTKCYGFWT